MQCLELWRSNPGSKTSLIVSSVLLLAGGVNARASATTAQSGVPLQMAAIRNQCIEFREIKQGSDPGDYRECRVSEFGELGTVGGQIFYYAIYCLIPSETAADDRCNGDSFVARYHRARGLAVFSGDVSRQNASLIFERASPEIGTVYYEKPDIIQNTAETILNLPIAIDGTGHGNQSEYYLRSAGGWDRIESENWLAELRKRLPAGLQIWKGVWPDLHTMTAEAGLYHADDANCCPTGGIARMRLAIRAKQLMIDSLVIDKAP